MSYKILNATKDDLPLIYRLFEEAIAFQRANHFVGWNDYDKKFLQADIMKGLLFKMINDEEIVCIFSICFADSLIWRERELGDALYLHRVVINQKYKGEGNFGKILDWAIRFAIGRNLNYLRMDTWAANEKIVSYYKSYGFCLVENYTTPGTDELPLQHRNLHVSLLELDLRNLPSQSSLNTSIAPHAPGNEIYKINLPMEMAGINKFWTQKIIGTANGQLIKLAKGIGELNWHQHDDQDELFLILKGHLTLQLPEKNIDMYQSDLCIVPRGTQHCPIANGEVELLLMGLNVTSNKAGGRPEKWTWEGQTFQ